MAPIGRRKRPDIFFMQWEAPAYTPVFLIFLKTRKSTALLKYVFIKTVWKFITVTVRTQDSAQLLIKLRY